MESFKRDAFMEANPNLDTSAMVLLASHILSDARPEALGRPLSTDTFAVPTDYVHDFGYDGTGALVVCQVSDAGLALDASDSGLDALTRFPSGAARRTIP